MRDREVDLQPGVAGASAEPKRDHDLVGCVDELLRLDVHLLECLCLGEDETDEFVAAPPLAGAPLGKGAPGRRAQDHVVVQRPLDLIHELGVVPGLIRAVQVVAALVRVVQLGIHGARQLHVLLRHPSGSISRTRLAGAGQPRAAGASLRPPLALGQSRSTTKNELPSGSRKKNIGGTGSPIRETSSSTLTPRVLQGGVGGIDVGAGERGPRLDPDRIALPRRHDGDRRRRAGRRHLEPAHAVTEWGVAAHLETELLRVELKRAVLVGHRDDHGPDLGDLRRCSCLRHSVLLWLVIWRLGPRGAAELIGRAASRRCASQQRPLPAQRTTAAA